MKILMTVMLAISIPTTALAVDKSELYIVKFGASWCAPCKKMERYVWPHSSVKREVAKYRNGKVWHIDTDKDMEWVRKYNITGVPTVMIMDKNGVALKRGVGYMTVAELTKFLSDGAIRTDSRGSPDEVILGFGAASILKYVVLGLAKLIIMLLG